MLTDWQIKLINRELGKLKHLAPSEVSEDVKKRIEDYEEILRNERENRCRPQSNTGEFNSNS